MGPIRCPRSLFGRARATSSPRVNVRPGWLNSASSSRNSVRVSATGRSHDAYWRRKPSSSPDVAHARWPVAVRRARRPFARAAPASCTRAAIPQAQNGLPGRSRRRAQLQAAAMRSPSAVRAVSTVNGHGRGGARPPAHLPCRACPGIIRSRMTTAMSGADAAASPLARHPGTSRLTTTSRPRPDDTVSVSAGTTCGLPR